MVNRTCWSNSVRFAKVCCSPANRSIPEKFLRSQCTNSLNWWQLQFLFTWRMNEYFICLLASFFFSIARANYYPLDYQIGFALVYPPYLDQFGGKYVLSNGNTCAWNKFCSMLIRHWSVVKNRSYSGWIREDTGTEKRNVLLSPKFLKRVYHRHQHFYLNSKSRACNMRYNCINKVMDA